MSAGNRRITVQILGDARSGQAAFAGLGDSADSVSVKIDGLGAHLSKLGELTKAAISGASFAIWNQVLDRATAALGSIREGIIGTNAALEQGAVSWSVLLGGVDKANAKIQELYHFAAVTPFAFGEVQQASLLLQTFGGDLLNTTKTLTLVGDVASGTNQSFQEVAFWAGRMYSAMQSGQPFGEAAMRLQEMGAISGDTLLQLEKMQKAGASGAQMWDVFTGSLGRFNGMMIQQSNTFTGRLSTLQDTWNQFLGVLGKPIFERASASMQKMIDLLSSDRAMRVANDIAAGLTKAYGLLDSILAGVAREAARALPYLGLVRDTFITMGQAAQGNWFGGQTASINIVTRSLGRFVQLSRDAILTFSQAFRGDWAGQATTSINGVVRVFGILGQYLGNTARNLRDLFSGRESIADYIGRMFSDRGDLLRKLGSLVTDSVFPAVGQVVVNFGQWWQRSGITARLGTFLSDRLRDLVTFVQVDVTPWAGHLFDRLGAWLSTNGPTLWTRLGDAVGDVGGFIFALSDKLAAWVQANQGPLTERLSAAGRTLGGLIMGAIAGTAGAGGVAGGTAFGGLADLFKGAIAGIFQLEKKDIEGQGVNDVLKLAGIAFARELIGGIGTGILQLVPSIDAFFTNLFNQNGQAGGAFGTAVGSNLGNAVQKALADLVIRFGKLADLLMIIFDNMGTNIGRFIEKGLITGMVDGARNMFKQMPDWLKNLLGISDAVNEAGFSAATAFAAGIKPVPLLTPEQIKYYQSIFAPPTPAYMQPTHGGTEGDNNGQNGPQSVTVNNYNTFNGLTVPEVVQAIGDGIVGAIGGGGGAGLLMP